MNIYAGRGRLCFTIKSDLLTNLVRTGLYELGEKCGVEYEGW